MGRTKRMVKMLADNPPTDRWELAAMILTIVAHELDNIEAKLDNIEATI